MLVPPWQCPTSAPAPPRGAPGGSGRPGHPWWKGWAAGRPPIASGARASRRFHHLGPGRHGGGRCTLEHHPLADGLLRRGGRGGDPAPARAQLGADPIPLRKALPEDTLYQATERRGRLARAVAPLAREPRIDPEGHPAGRPADARRHRLVGPRQDGRALGRRDRGGHQGHALTERRARPVGELRRDRRRQKDRAPARCTPRPAPATRPATARHHLGTSAAPARHLPGTLGGRPSAHLSARGARRRCASSPPMPR